MPDSYTKDPAARLDYTWDWVDWLAEISDTISTATVTVPSGLTAVGLPAITPTAVTQRIEGGVLGGYYPVVCQITTTDGLIDERTINLTISNQ